MDDKLAVRLLEDNIINRNKKMAADIALLQKLSAESGGGSGIVISDLYYRQFVYEVDGGDFSFVIDEEGQPVMALENLETLP